VGTQLGTHGKRGLLCALAGPAPLAIAGGALLRHKGCFCLQRRPPGGVCGSRAGHLGTRTRTRQARAAVLEAVDCDPLRGENYCRRNVWFFCLQRGRARGGRTGMCPWPGTPGAAAALQVLAGCCWGCHLTPAPLRIRRQPPPPAPAAPDDGRCSRPGLWISGGREATLAMWW
jgi:hypothetical protein